MKNISFDCKKNGSIAIITVSIGLLNGHSQTCSRDSIRIHGYFFGEYDMLKVVCFLITSLLILPLNAEEIDLVNKIILKITDSSTLKEGDKMQFEVLSYNHGVAMPIMTEGPSYRPVYQDYTVTKYLDLYSAYLLEKCARGGVIPEVVLTYYQRSKNGSFTYKALEVQMVNAMVTSVSVGGGGDRPIETITFNFDSIRYSVTALSSSGKLETKTFLSKVSKN